MDRDPIEQLRLLCWPESRDYVNRLLDEIEAQYMKLPVDADGVPIRPGQTIYENDREIPGSCVCGVDDKRVYIWDYSNDFLILGVYASSFTHEKPDAIKDLLEEYSDAILQCTCPDYVGDDKPGALREEYAKKIREVVNNG